MSMWNMDRRGFFKLTGTAAAGFALPSALTACGGSSGSAGGSSSSTLRVSMPTDVTSLDPQKQGDIPSMSVASNIFDTLTTRDANNKLVGALATEWKAVDPATWRFTIREGVKFHNGEPCDATAVAYSINRLVNPATKSPIVELSYVKGAKVVDASTVDFMMSAADPIIPEKVSLFGGVIVPPNYIQQKGDAGFAASPVGTGPFKFESRQQDNQITLVANDAYWGTKPTIRQLVIKIMPNAASSLAALQSGEVDIVTGLTADAANQLGEGSGASVKSTVGIRNYYVSLDTTAGPLANADVRNALNYAVNVPVLISTVLQNAAQRTPTMIPQQVFGYDTSITAFEHDLGKAKSLLAAAGYPNGFSTQITASTVDKDIVQAVAGQLSAAGVNANVKLVDAATFKQGLVSSNKKALGDMYFAGNTGWTLDGESYLQSNIKSDRRQSRWNDSQANKLIDTEEQSLQTQTRQTAFSELQTLLKTQSPFIYMYHGNNVYALRDSVDWTMPINGVLAMATAKVK